MTKLRVGVLVGAAFLILIHPRSGAAQWRESFESIEPTWRLQDQDIHAQITAQRRVFEGAQSGNGCEFVQLVAGQGAGTKIFLAHPIPAARAIAELNPSVWVRASRLGVQLFARVVLPRSVDPNTGRPLTTLIRGSMYDQVGSWQRLAIDDVATRVRRQANYLRIQLKSDVDAREAYIDMLVLNTYTGPGALNLWIDELNVTHHVSAPAAPRFSAVGHGEGPRPSAIEQSVASAPAGDDVRVNGSLVEIDGRPTFARIIEHNGESLEWLKSLGFLVVKLKTSPTRQQLQEAARLGMWLVAPPPHLSVKDAGADYRRVLAWSLGSRLAARDLAATRTLASDARAAASRPTVCSPAAQVDTYAELTDILLLDNPAAASPSKAHKLTDWLRERGRQATFDRPFWACVPTQPALETATQISAVDPQAAATMRLGADHVRQMAFAAAAAGVRGVCFKSRSRLDRRDASSQARAKLLKLINHELSLIEPWGAAGAAAPDIDLPDPRWQASVLRTDRARLLIVLQFPQSLVATEDAAPSSATRAIVFKDSAAPSSAAAMLVADSGLESIVQQNRQAGGVRVVLADPQPISLVLVASDRLAERHLNQRLVKSERAIGQLRYEIAAAELNWAQLVQRQLIDLGQVDRAAADSIQRADGRLRLAAPLLTDGDLQFVARYTRSAMHDLAAAREVYERRAAHGFASPAASPFCMSFDALPLHWRLSSLLRDSRWSPNSLAAGDLESLDHMRAAGWRQHRSTTPDIGAAAELSLENPHAGRSALRIYSWAAGASARPDAADEPPVWITSAPVRVLRGQLARIQGWVQVRGTTVGDEEGLLILDSVGGLSASQLFGRTGGWTPFSFYRVIPQDGDLTVTFALHGFAEAWIDDVSIETIDLQQALLSPLSTRP